MHPSIILKPCICLWYVSLSADCMQFNYTTRFDFVAIDRHTSRSQECWFPSSTRPGHWCWPVLGYLGWGHTRVRPDLWPVPSETAAWVTWKKKWRVVRVGDKNWLLRQCIQLTTQWTVAALAAPALSGDSQLIWLCVGACHMAHLGAVRRSVSSTHVSWSGCVNLI